MTVLGIQAHPQAPVPLPAFRGRCARLAATAVAVAAAIACVLTGPPRPALFDLRLPLLVLAAGAVWNAARWRQRPARPARWPVPMATPWLIMTATAGVAAVTAKVVTADPALVGALLAVGAAACCLAVGLCVMAGRGRRAARPDNGDREDARAAG